MTLDLIEDDYSDDPCQTMKNSVNSIHPKSDKDCTRSRVVQLKVQFMIHFNFGVVLFLLVLPRNWMLQHNALQWLIISIIISSKFKPDWWCGDPWKYFFSSHLIKWNMITSSLSSPSSSSSSSSPWSFYVWSSSLSTSSGGFSAAVVVDDSDAVDCDVEGLELPASDDHDESYQQSWYKINVINNFSDISIIIYVYTQYTCM